jgi:hypothetical protein
MLLIEMARILICNTYTASLMTAVRTTKQLDWRKI